MRNAVIVSAKRTACGKANKGSFRFMRPDSLAGFVIKALLEENPNLDPAEVEDVILGCAFPEGVQGLNVARQAAALGGLPNSVPAITINRYCSSGLQSISMASERIMCGHAEVIIAGGLESMTLIPKGGYSVQPNADLMVDYPEIYINMGLTAENVATLHKVSREDQDEFSYYSHKKAIKAQQDKVFESQIVPIEVKHKYVMSDGSIAEESKWVNVDEGPRADTSLEVLAKLRPVFKAGGSVTAGNSSQMNDAASAVIVMSEEKANELGLKPLARYVGFAVGGVAPELMGLGPIEAIPKVLKLTGLKKSDMDLIELNEAFASQSLAVIRELDLNPEVININGGAIAMGHPLGCTGSKLTTQILHDLHRLDKKYGMVTMCIGGGMGAAGIFERL